VAVIARFDRRRGGRVHYLSAQSFMGLEEAAGGFYADLADVMRAHCADHRAQLEELHRRIMFTILVSNNDDHLKNHGFLYAGEGKWALAPAFDVNPQPERHRQLETGISELSGFEASIKAAIEAAPFFDLTEDHARANLGELVTVVRDQWQDHCRDAGMSGSEIAAYRAAFEHAEFETALRMGAPRVAARPTSGASP
jgi:serine/threonine-protein kinase HipA